MARTRSWQFTEQTATRRLGVLNAEESTAVRRSDGMPKALRSTWLGGLPEPWTFFHGGATLGQQAILGFRPDTGTALAAVCTRRFRAHDPFVAVAYALLAAEE